MTNQSGPSSWSVTFLPADRKVTVESGTALIKAARLAGVHINASCGGSGVCGKCRIIVESGNLTGGKSDKISADEFAQGFRQACLAMVTEDVTIRVPEESGLRKGGLTAVVPARHTARMHVYDIKELREENIFQPPVEKLFLELPRPSAVDNMADAGRVIQSLRNQYDYHGIIIGLSVLQKLPRILREDDFRVTVTLALPVSSKGRHYIVNIQPGNWSKRNYGLAFDIGTTTIYGQLIDLSDGRVVSQKGDYNAQLSYGEDVISRIIYAEKPEGLEMMHDLVRKTINGIIGSLLKNSGIEGDEISSITLAGNTTMTHLFLKLLPDHIRRAPYLPVSTFFPPMRAADLGIELPHHVVALIFPAISSYVGGDIVAGVMGSGMYRADKLSLYIDIGTNAEIVIGNREWLACAACSAGPAFEGGGITHGMRAAEGAIEDFSLNPETFEPMNITLGNKPAVGICGSGLLVIIATLFENGVLDRQGKFNRHLETERIREGRSGYEYLLVRRRESGIDHDIVLNEVDIENFIRAKAAIYAGVKTLMEEVGLRISDIEQIIMAGAFGSYIDLDSAMAVGLLPEVDMEKIVYVGNGSLQGGRMSELSNHIRKDVVDVVNRMTSFELSEVTGFHDQYIASLFLPHTDITLFPRTAARLRKSETVE